MAEIAARRGRCSTSAVLVAAVLVLSGCAYDPPMKADHASAKYRADLAACQESGDREANRRVKARGILFLTYPMSLPIERRVQTRRCLEGKGYQVAD